MSNLLLLLDIEKYWFVNIFRSLFAFLDYIVYYVITFLFRAVFNLANFELYGLFDAMEERVYVILGIFMLFKVTISLITYLVNPDKITDKEQGASKVVVRIITVLVMLIGLPTFFSLMTEAQNKFLPVVPRVIIGTDTTLDSEDVGGISENMALTMINGFAHKKDRCDGGEFTSLEDFLNNINESCTDDDNTYKYDYLPIISTITGAIMCYVIFSLCINVAIRAFKLIILRSIAPIPIISYIDPKSSKDGAFASWRKMFFSTWAELFVQIGLIYFIVFIIDYMLSDDMWKGFFSGIDFSFVGVVDSIFLIAFLIIGLLFFAKQAPKFIYDALGIKSTGNFMRMLGMGATAVGGVGATRSAFRARQEYDAENSGNTRLSTLKNAGASLFSGLGSAAAGGNALLSTDKPNLTTGYDAQSKNNATMLSRINAGSTLGGRLGSMGQMLIAGETTADVNERNIKAMEDFNKALGSIGSRAKDEMVKQDWTYGNSGFTTLDAYGNKLQMQANYKTFMAKKNAAASAGETSFNYDFIVRDKDGNVHTVTRKVEMEEANMNEGLILKTNEDNYIEKQVELKNASDKSQVMSSDGKTAIGNKYDSVMAANITDAEEKAVAVTDKDVTKDYYSDGKFKISGRDSVKKTQDAISIDSTQLRRENEKHISNRRGQGNKGN